jgi:hypothetical protein
MNLCFCSIIVHESFTTTQEVGPPYQATSNHDLDNLCFTSWEEIVKYNQLVKDQKGCGTRRYIKPKVQNFNAKDIAYVNELFNPMLPIPYFPNRWKLAVVFISKLKNQETLLKTMGP